jgi:hypothetical protein
VVGEEVICPWHGSRFNVKTGSVLTPPARQGVESFPVRWPETMSKSESICRAAFHHSEAVRANAVFGTEERFLHFELRRNNIGSDVCRLHKLERIPLRFVGPKFRPVLRFHGFR